MLSSISWACYLIVAALLLGIYYCYVLVRYYRKEIKNFITRRPAEHEPTSSKPESNQLSLFESTDDTRPPNESVDLFSLAFELSARIKMVMEVAAAERYSKAGLIIILRKLISEYPAIKGTAFQVAINNVILGESKELGSNGLQDDDVSALW
ncbi:hypothetical protein PV783_17340 [Chitinophaga sp. CC14]|uniref:hypothetical protein n=1 Tax=Chitinophaga sp. CC14 TaxID=3029199 RepID=UPI003B7D6859